MEVHIMKVLAEIVEYSDDMIDTMFSAIFDNLGKNVIAIVDPGSDEEKKFFFDEDGKITEPINYEIEKTNDDRGMVHAFVKVDEVPEVFEKFVEHLQDSANGGHSFSVELYLNDEKVTEFFIDGDGANRIYSGGKSDLVNFSKSK